MMTKKGFNLMQNNLQRSEILCKREFFPDLSQLEKVDILKEFNLLLHLYNGYLSAEVIYSPALQEAFNSLQKEVNKAVDKIESLPKKDGDLNEILSLKL